MLAQKQSYKFAFILATSLHLAIIIFLFVKFALPSRYTSSSVEENIIQAVAVTPSEYKAMRKILPVPKPEVQKVVAPVNAKQEVALKQQADLQAIKFKKQLLKKQEMQKMQTEIAREAKKMDQEKQQAALQQTMERELANEKQALAARAVTQKSQGEVDKYKALVLQAISSNWIVPDGVDKNATCLLLVNVAPGGTVLDVKLIQSSGNPLLDRSAEVAVLKSSPLPVPSDAILFDNFRTIRLTVRPEGIF